MKTVHNERLQELSNRHQQERDGLLAGINQRCAACQSDQHSFPWLSMLCIKTRSVLEVASIGTSEFA